MLLPYNDILLREFARRPVAPEPAASARRSANDAAPADPPGRGLVERLLVSMGVGTSFAPFAH